MEINKLRSIIKEAVDAQLKEIEAVAENAAMEARLAEYDKAIKTCEIKIETAENLEEVKDLMDEGKINELKKKLKSLTKAKEKLEKAKAKKNKGKEVVTDEPVEDTVDEGSYYDEAESDDAAHIDALEKDMEDDAMNNEVALNESFLKMQKLAGVITEAQYNSKKSLIENQLNEAEEKTIQTYGPNLVNMLKQNGFDTKFTTNDSEGKKAQEFAKTSDKKLAVVYYNTRQYILVTTNEKNRDEAFKIITSPAVERLLPDGYKTNKQGGYFIEIQNPN